VVGLGGLFLAATVVMLRPTPHTLAATLPNDPGDPALVIWILSWGVHSLVTDPLGILDANIFHPHTRTLAFSEPMLALVPVYGLLVALTRNPVLSFNLLALGLVVLNLAATWALARRLVGDGRAALVAALVAGFNGYTLARHSHLQLQAVGFLPLAFLALFALLERQRPRDGLWLGVATVAVALSALYYAAIWVVAAGVVVALELVRRRGRFGPGLWLGLGVAGAVPALVLGPLGLVYRQVGLAHGGQRVVRPADSLLAADWLTPAPGNWLWGSRLAALGAGSPPGERAFFLGLTASVLALAGMVLVLRWWATRPGRAPGGPARRTRHAAPGGTGTVRWWELTQLAAAGAVAVVVAAGPEPGGLPGPFGVLARVVPGFSGMRVPSRLAVVAVVALAVLVGLAVAVLLARLAPRARAPVTAALVVVVLAEALTLGLVRYPAPGGPAREAVYDELARREPGVVVELPFADPGRGVAWAFVEAPRMMLATRDFNPRVNGYSGFFPRDYLHEVNLMNALPEARSVARLEQLGVRYLVLHLGFEQGYPAFTPAEAATLVAGLPGDPVAERHGDAWLVDIRPG
jgi:hypothetical protein